MTALKILGDTVRGHRRRLGISQEALAELAGLHRTYVGSVERGERNVAVLNLLRIARALEVSPSSLLVPLDDHPDLHPTALEREP